VLRQLSRPTEQLNSELVGWVTFVGIRSVVRALRSKRLVTGGLYAIACDREDGCDHKQPG
jgi:hypothetical protein